jgi:hypothetical protein
VYEEDMVFMTKVGKLEKWKVGKLEKKAKKSKVKPTA